MKTIKPGAVALLTRTIEYRGRFRFIVTPMLFVTLQGPLRLRGEAALWQFVAEELGPEAALDACMPKVRGEYIVQARASPPGGAAPACAVRARCAEKEKTLVVFGERRWQRNSPGPAEPFSELALTWKQSYGGVAFPANLDGIGHAKPIDPAVPWALPRVEYPHDPSLRPGAPVRPAGFGGRDAAHPDRAALLGTYDDNWLKTDYPGLARDVDWRHFNVSAEDQWLDLPIAADAPWEFEHLHPTRPYMSGKLPGIVPRCFITRLNGGQPRCEEIPTQLETVLFFPHRECAVLISRGSIEVAEEDAEEIKLLLAAAEWQGESRSLAHYAEAIEKRLDPATGHFLMLKEDDLLPSGIDERYGVEQFVSAPLADPRPLLGANLMRRQRAEIEGARALVASHGIDPDAGHAPSLPAPTEALPKRLEDLPLVLAAMQARAEAGKAELAALEKKSDAARRAVIAELGMDYAVIEKEYSATPKGPPAFSAQAQFDTLAQVRATLAASRGPVAEIDQYLNDPVFRERMHSTERQSKEAYRLSAHLQSAVEPMPADRAGWIRARAEQHGQAGKSFAGINLTGARLGGLDFAGCDFSAAQLEGVDFAGCNLAGCCFDKAVLARADLTGANLSAASLRDANLGEANLAGGDFSGAVLDGAILRGARFARARFAGASFAKVDLIGGADFRDADLSGSNAADIVLLDADLRGLVCRDACLDRAAFVRCDLGKSDFSGASLERAAFIEVKAVGAAFVGARLVKTVFVGVNVLDGANFSGAEIHTCNFRPASLRGARFERARILESDFSSADLTEATFAAADATQSRFVKADLRGATLAGAKLMNSSFANARLEGADLRETNLYGADLARVAIDTATRFDRALTVKARVLPRRRDPTAAPS